MLGVLRDLLLMPLILVLQLLKGLLIRPATELLLPMPNWPLTVAKSGWVC